MSPVELGPFPDVEGYDEAAALDAADPLRACRDQFVITDTELIYLDGNSLGRMPQAATEIVDQVVNRQWGDRLIRAWNEGWWELQLRLGDMLAPLIGASSGEVMISDSTSVNIYKLADAAVATAPSRQKIITDDLNFPTDAYILDGIARRRGMTMEIVPSNGIHGPVAGLADSIDAETALVSLSHTVFKSGYTYDMAEITAMTHDVGAMILWDCSHSVGALPIGLNASDADLAVGCTYKYLNGGPGSPAFAYVRSDLQERLENPITAWWGHAEPFAFDLEFQPVSGIRRFHTGTMPILSLAAIEAGIAGVLDAGIDSIRAKSVALTEFLISQWDTHLKPHGFGLASPKDPTWRGSHISLSHELAWPLTRAMVEAGQVVPDFRAPDNIRLGLSPLYNTFAEVHTTVQRVRQIIGSGAHTAYMDVTATVT